jgi:putative SOS response-associated peptidase YedK
VSLPDGALFGMAALVSCWRGGGGELLESCAIVTMPARGVVGALHDRMPWILDPSDYATWLDPGTSSPAALPSAGLAERLVQRAVSDWVNDPRHEGPGCLAPASPEAQRSLF